MADLIMGRVAYRGIVTNSITGETHKTQRYTFYRAALKAAEAMSKKFGGEIEIITVARQG